MLRAFIRFVRLHVWRLLCTLFFFSAGIHGTLGAALFLPKEPYRYTVLDQDLSAALQQFGNNLNIRINISAEVKGRIRGSMPDLPPREFLDRLANLFGLQWYYDGLVVYVSATKELQTRMLVFNLFPFESFKGALDKLDISDDRYVMRPAPGDGLVLVSGPPRFTALVEEAFNGLVAKAQAQPLVPETPPRESVLILFRGSSTMFVRNGLPGAAPPSDVPQQDGTSGKPEPGHK
ncbi:nodulation protein NolW [Sinorhizobium meliloti]|uniref:nodulation protein NolW n=1 Tax=Rhizobium meliloti TaxID=382 RepID=UPI002072AD6B|nr:nodulation protein NolW [Sinorhizobium meliloti]MCM5689887.1 nodulation protein NolW [Sinorhizobium meliloti]